MKNIELLLEENEVFIEWAKSYGDYPHYKVP
jgi:hypothetical protein